MPVLDGLQGFLVLGRIGKCQAQGGNFKCWWSKALGEASFEQGASFRLITSLGDSIV